MKGHMEKDGFHPHTQYKGVRKSKVQKTKSKGVKIRKRSQILNEYTFRIEKDKTFGKKEIFTEGYGTAIKALEEENADRIVNQKTGEVLSKESIDIQRTQMKKRDEQDSGEIPPNEIYDSNRLDRLDGRFFLVAEGYPDTLAVDEYTKVSPNLFKHKRTVYFAQSSEDSEETLRMVGGGGVSKYSGVYGLQDEMEFLRGLSRAGGLDG